ncbi:MAG: GNAT family N-acetyltransferase [Methylobacter sp.]|nr:GNAT family N-acetyltransferase [Methylobacter sp.]MDP2099585.1 GNAT family N-acetyltransferase [Methylobacter sp.]MDP2429781.1 GNAT family N-acetyltransferase [Methylobacter sp.]MDP3055501.1 GNAT family N-acetyltransferase [Methylobacter sp.]MDP3363375.1 GNAT family N-acetyltransferase [Methylobacter sp.]
MANDIRVERWSGAALEQFIPELARLRIEVFRDFPYLYDGDINYEKKYLQTYIDCPESVIVIAFDGDRVVGASTAIPMKYETDELKQPFLDNGYNLDEVFYCSESVLDKNYRGLGIGVRFFEQREAHADDLGGFKHICFCCVERPADHPRRPADYVPLDKFWNKRGYVKHPELHTSYIWKDLDDSEENPKPMTFWLKQ